MNVTKTTPTKTADPKQCGFHQYGQGWKSGAVLAKECDFAPQVAPSKVVMPFPVRAKIIAMNTVMGGDEWLAYLIGEKRDDAYYIEDIVVPQQEVASASVDVTDDTTPERVIGTIHSHHSMGAFHSGTDHEYVVANHEVCIVSSTTGWKTTVKAQLPCGMNTEREATLTIAYPDDGSLQTFVTEALAKIFKRVYTVPATQYNQPASNPNMEHGDQWGV